MVGGIGGRGVGRGRKGWVEEGVVWGNEVCFFLL